MGAWDYGILDNDTALDGLGAVVDGVVADIDRLAGEPSNEETVGRLAAAVGIVLQLAPAALDPDTGNDRTRGAVVAALTVHADGIGAHLSPGAQRILGLIADGEVALLEQHPAEPVDAVSVDGDHAVHLAEPALFEHLAAGTYVDEVATRCVQAFATDAADEEVWTDLAREAAGVGALAALLVLEPCDLPVELLTEWQQLAALGLAELELSDDGELDFHQPYHANLDAVFDALLDRAGAPM
ncbi:MAG: hypothetical protein S0880_01880 [Actinomycetota bacterium]|nr:hypothetical protein [Actinomycetota bacterium]